MISQLAIAFLASAISAACATVAYAAPLNLTGTWQPVEDNKADEGKALNRRVEIIVAR